MKKSIRIIKGNIKYILLSCIMFCFLSCSNHGGKEFREGLLCKCIIFPTGTFQETYQINLYEDGTICTFYGTRRTDLSTQIERGDIIDGIVIENIETQKRGKINADTLEHIKKCLSDNEGKQCFHPNDMNWKDSWCVLIETSNSLYLHRHCDFDNNEIEHIYEQLKKYSPIPIDIHGWA